MSTPSIQIQPRIQSSNIWPPEGFLPLSIPVETLVILIPVIASISLHFGTRFFADAEKLRPKLDLLAEDKKSHLGSIALKEMEDDVERSLKKYDLISPLGADFVVRRRTSEASNIAESAWAKATEHAVLFREYKLLWQWEERGKMFCAIGTFINLGLIPTLFVLIVINPFPNIVNTTYLWIAFVVVMVPIIVAAFCYLISYMKSRSLNKQMEQQLII